MFIGVRVIVSEQMQDAVNAQQLEFVLGAVPIRLRLPGGDLGAEHNVAEQAWLRFWFLPGGRGARSTELGRRAKLVHREGKHVGGTGFAHPTLMQLRHGALVHKQNRQLSERMDAHPAEHVAGDAAERDLVYPGARLVRDIDAQLAHLARCAYGHRPPLRGRRRALVPC